jgi:hypothetical protein
LVTTLGQRSRLQWSPGSTRGNTASSTGFVVARHFLAA